MLTSIFCQQGNIVSQGEPRLWIVARTMTAIVQLAQRSIGSEWEHTYGYQIEQQPTTNTTESNCKGLSSSKIWPPGTRTLRIPSLRQSIGCGNRRSGKKHEEYGLLRSKMRKLPCCSKYWKLRATWSVVVCLPVRDIGRECKGYHRLSERDPDGLKPVDGSRGDDNVSLGFMYALLLRPWLNAQIFLDQSTGF